MTKIYGLFDPRTNELRYVGKTIMNLNNAYSRHLNDKWINHKTNWIKNLKNEGLKPVIDLIDEVSDNEWEFWEKWYIQYFRSIGCYLTNHSEGGEGTPGFRPSKETRLKMSLKKIGSLGFWRGKHRDEKTKSILRTCATGRIFSKECITKFRKNRTGKTNYSSRKIKDIDVKNIQELYLDGIKCKELQKEFNVSQATISRIINKKLIYT